MKAYLSLFSHVNLYHMQLKSYWSEKENWWWIVNSQLNSLLFWFMLMLLVWNLRTKEQWEGVEMFFLSKANKGKAYKTVYLSKVLRDIHLNCCVIVMSNPGLKFDFNNESIECSFICACPEWTGRNESNAFLDKFLRIVTMNSYESLKRELHLSRGAWPICFKS